jgi:hypothetical protein
MKRSGLSSIGGVTAFEVLLVDVKARQERVEATTELRWTRRAAAVRPNIMAFLLFRFSLDDLAMLVADAHWQSRSFYFSVLQPQLNGFLLGDVLRSVLRCRSGKWALQGL